MFSKKYSTFNEWIADQLDNTDYKHRIIRLHNLYPDSTLDQLRGHATSDKRPLRKIKAIQVSRRSWLALSPNERLAREKALDVLSNVRRNKKSLTKACQEKGVSIQMVLKNTNAFKKVGRRWVPKTYDRISRMMLINECGHVTIIEVDDSRTASLIGLYHSMVKKALEEDDWSYLAQFEGVMVKDTMDIYYPLETDLDKLREIQESIEEPEFYDIYSV